MLNLSVLESKINALISTSPSDLKFDEEGESIEVVFQNDWVQIILARARDAPSITMLEVEITPPVIDIDTSKPNDSAYTKILDGTIEHLEYLRNLSKCGFTLELIGQDGLWTAYYKIEQDISTDILGSLVPPCI